MEGSGSLLPRMAGMDMAMDMSASNSSCSVDMLWNWTVIDSCFLANSWHVTTKGMFAVSCIGVALLGVCLEFLRRVSKDYEETLQRQFQRHAISSLSDPLVCGASPSVITYRASPLQQLIRAVLHLAQFGTAYILMLIAMAYNGYMIVCILIGVFIGKVFFDWGQYRVVLGMQGASPLTGQVQVQEEATKSCG